MEYITLILMAFFASTSLFIFFTIKGAFHTRHLVKENAGLIVFSSLFSLAVYTLADGLNYMITLLLFVPMITGLCFMVLLIYRFYRNPKRHTQANADEFLAAADGQIIYIKEIEAGKIPVSIKKSRLSRLEELTKTNLIKEPCYLIGITMTLFDVHVNRAPMAGKVILSQHTPGKYLGLKSPDSTLENERNTIIIENDSGLKVGVVQIASRFVKRCISTVTAGEEVSHGGQIGLIRWGSQADMIIPRNSDIKVRNGDQVYAGITVIAKYSAN